VATAAGAAHAENACLKGFESASTNMASFDPTLATTASEIKHVQQAGLDPNRYIDEYEGSYVLLTVKFHALAEKVASETETSSNGASACKPNIMPYRQMADVKMIYQHYDLGTLLPPQMAATDYLQVVKSGRIPAGGSAMMPHGESASMHDMAIGGMTAMIMQKRYCYFGSCSSSSPF
jgi:hypothetical protein